VLGAVDAHRHAAIGSGLEHDLDRPCSGRGFAQGEQGERDQAG
jgi:hypothetical protein